jgi:hypothetical protein
MGKQMLTIAFTIADCSAHVDAPTMSDVQTCGARAFKRGDTLNEGIERGAEYIPYDALSMLVPLMMVPSVHIKAAPTRKLECGK